MATKPLWILAPAAVLLCVLGTANAASISIVPGSVNATVGDFVSLDITADFSGVTTIGGGFDVVFDSDILSFHSFESSYPGDPDFSRQPDALDGRLEGLAFGDFNGLSGDFGVIGTMVFLVIDAGSGEVTGTVGNSLNSGFLDADTFQLIDVTYTGATVNALVPVPAAAWLMLGGLGAFFGFGRIGLDRVLSDRPLLVRRFLPELAYPVTS